MGDWSRTKARSALGARAIGRAVLWGLVRLWLLARAALVGIGIWLLFTRVIKDEQLALEYLRALAWPAVVLLALTVFKTPLSDRLGRLVHARWGSGEVRFVGDLNETLATDLAEPIASLSGGSEDADSPEAFGQNSATLDGASSPGEEPPTAETQKADPEPSAHEVTLDELVRAIADAQERVAVTSKASPALRQQIRRAAERDPVGTVESMAHLAAKTDAELRLARTRSLKRTRDDIEQVIRSSARWGHAMGRAGAPEAVPDIEWNKDGTWKIVTEVPERTHVAASSKGSAERARLKSVDRREQAIRRLEDEIMAIEKKNSSMGGCYGPSVPA